MIESELKIMQIRMVVRFKKRRASEYRSLVVVFILSVVYVTVINNRTKDVVQKTMNKIKAHQPKYLVLSYSMITLIHTMSLQLSVQNNIYYKIYSISKNLQCQ